MTNWATLNRQPTRLPVLAAGIDPRTDWFYCEPFACKLPKTGCANRHRLSQQRTTDGLSYQAVTYGACRNCNVGAAHARGEPTPLFITREITIMTDETETTIKHRPDRECSSCSKVFAPTAPYQKRCAECTAARPTRRIVKRKAVARRGALRVEQRAPDPALLEHTTKTSNGHTNGVDPMVTAYDLLEMAGYSVSRIRTPSGELLRVS